MNAAALAMAVVHALGWALLQSLWQMALIGVGYALLRVVLPRGNPRYLAAMLSLIAVAVVPAWTFWHALPVPLSPMASPGAVAAVGTTLDAVPAATAGARSIAWLQAVLPWLVLAWGCGVVVLGLRFARQWRRLRAIVRAAEALPAWQARARALADRLGLRRAAPVLGSVRIATPTLVGWVRPAIVLPLALLAAMPREQVELILAHELAHLRRLDHFANLFQVLLEIVFFYHPVVHWISRDARNEREMCCDALALRASGGSRRDFVAALAGLEEFRAGHPGLALAASGGLLAERAWFLAGVAPSRARRRVPGALLAVLAATLVVLLAVLWWQRPLRDDASAPHLDVPALALTLPMPQLQVSAPQLSRLPAVDWNRGHPADAEAPVRTAVGHVAPLPLQMRIADPVHIASMPEVSPVSVAMPSAAFATTSVESVTLHPIAVVAPVYPPQALANDVHGEVVLAFRLDARGRPQQIAVVSATPGGVFDAAARDALAQWRFPASGTTRGMWLRQTFRFTPGAAGGTAAVRARSDCEYRTGSHICRDFDADGPGPLRLARPGH